MLAETQILGSNSDLEETQGVHLRLKPNRIARRADLIRPSASDKLSLLTLPPELFALILSFLPETTPASDASLGFSNRPSICSFAASHLLTHTSRAHNSSGTKSQQTSMFGRLRLVCRSLAYHPIVCDAAFGHLLDIWLDEVKSHRMISNAASEVWISPAGVGGWSPWALEDVRSDEYYEAEEDEEGTGNGEEAVGRVELEKEERRARRQEEREGAFVEVLWMLLKGRSVEDEGISGVKDLTLDNFGERTGRKDLTAKRLRMGMSRLPLYRRLANL